MTSMSLDYDRFQLSPLKNKPYYEPKQEVKKAMKWDCIKQFHLNPPMFALPREDNILEEYEKNMKLIKQKTTIVDYLINKYLSGTQTV